MKVRTLLLFIMLVWGRHCVGQERNIARVGNNDRAPQKWALLIGVNQYAAASRLQYAERDMEQLERLLLASGFDSDHVLTFTNSAREVARRPFRSLIERQLDKLLGRLDADGKLLKPGLVQAGDVVVVALSGHGVHFEGQGSFFCPSDADLDYPETLVSLEHVYKRLLNSKAALKLIVVDACRNDPRKPAKGVDGNQSESTKQFARSLANCPEGIVMMTSCQAGQVSREDDDLGHGVFLKHMLEALEGAADQPAQNKLNIGDGNGRVSLKEAFQFAKQKTQAYVAKKWSSQQEPEIVVGEQREALDFEFGTYSSLLPFTSFFAVRIENAQGPPARGVEIAVRYRAAEGAPSVVLGRATTDDAGRAEMTLRLSKQQRTSGLYTGTVYYDGIERSSDLPGFLEQREWNLYAPRNSPLAERVKELLAEKKTTEALDLVWKEWDRANAQVKQLFEPVAAVHSEWWLKQALKEVKTETDAAQQAACYATLAAEHIRRGDNATAEKCFDQALAAIDRVADTISAAHLTLETMHALADAGDVALAKRAAKRANLLAEGIPMDGQQMFDRQRRDGFVKRLLRMHINVEIAALLYRLRDPDANHYLEVAYELFSASSDSSNFYYDLAAYVRIMALCRAGDITQLKRMEHLKDGQIRLYQLTGNRKFIPLGAPAGFRATINHQEQLNSWTLRLYSEVALAAAKSNDRNLYRVYSRAADTKLTSAEQMRLPPLVIAECLGYVIEAAALSGDVDSALKRLEINHEQFSQEQQDQLRQTIARQLATTGRFTDAWQQLTQLSENSIASSTFHNVVQASWPIVVKDLSSTVDTIRSIESRATRAATYAAFAPQSILPNIQIRNTSSTGKLYLRIGDQNKVVNPATTLTVHERQVEFYDGTIWKQIHVEPNGVIEFDVTKRNNELVWTIRTGTPSSTK